MIREATIDDVEQLTNVHVLSWQSAYRGLLPDDALDSIRFQERIEMWRKTICRSPSETVVAEVDSGIVGFANFGPYRHDDGLRAGEIRAIYLLPEFWRKGIGSELLTHASEYIKDSYEQILMWVLSSNQNAISFYEGHGFKRDGIEKEENVWGTVVHEIRMSKTINA